MNGTMSDGEKPAFTVPVNPLEKIPNQAPPKTEMNDTTSPFTHYFNMNGAFVDILKQGKYAQSLKTKDVNREWSQQGIKNTDDFEWSCDQINTLLEFYAEYPQLWDTKHDRYMNKDVRKQLISQLSERVGAPEQAVNIKFQRLRVHFSRELRKEESSAHELHPYQSKWKYYNKMLFLKDTLKCRQKIRQSNCEKEYEHLGVGNIAVPVITSITSATSSDSGHSSPESELVSPIHTSVSHNISPHITPDNKENHSPRIKPKIAPLSPSLISTPFSSLPSSLVPPLLGNNQLFNAPTLPTPPASLLNSFASLEHLLSPGMLAPMLAGGNKPNKDTGTTAGLNNLLTNNGSLLAPTPQIPTSPLTPNVVCSAVPMFWNTPHVLTSSKSSDTVHHTLHTEDDISNKLYQAKRQKLKEEVHKHKDKVDIALQRRMPIDSQVTDCDYFSMHVSESLRKMDIIMREECKRAIQNTIYQYIVKSCCPSPTQHPQRSLATAFPYQNFPTTSLGNTTNVRIIGRKPT